MSKKMTLLLCALLCTLLCTLFCACGEELPNTEPPSSATEQSEDDGSSAAEQSKEESPSPLPPESETSSPSEEGCAHGNVEILPAVEATCQKEGMSEGRRCKDCGKVLSEQVVLPVGGHKEVIDEAVKPTCSQMGWTAGAHCAYCGETLKWQEPVEMPLHQFKDGTCSRCGIPTHSQGLYYTLSNDQSYYILDSVGNCKDKTLIIPPLYGGLPVKELNAFDSQYATAVVIPDSVTTLSSRLFYQNEILREVTLGAGVTEVGALTFADCTALEKITLRGKVHFGKSCFEDTKNIKELHVADIASWCQSTFSASAGYPLQYGGGVICLDGEPIVDLVIPEGVTEIGASCFKNCTSIKKVSFPEGLAVIGEQAFYGCTALEELTLPATAAQVKSSAFAKCTSLKEVRAEEGVASISMHAFNGCTALERVSLPNSVTAISTSCFEGCSALKSLTFGKETKSISRNAFKGCTALTNVILPKSLETVEDAAFEGLAGQCYFLEADALPAGFASRWTGKDASVYTGGQWSLVNGTPTVG
ncbi:MAG: leucine-rich repeat domain-containing protein [Clostridia bacterium]|nr:leucine-rich repeat domain-containing protein [Clostridia bacterium]